MPGYTQNAEFCILYPRASVGLQRPTEPLAIKSNSQINMHISLRELVTPISPQFGLVQYTQGHIVIDVRRPTCRI